MCYQTGGNLASVHTPEERQFVRQLANTNTPVWLGEYHTQQVWWWWWSRNLVNRALYFTKHPSLSTCSSLWRMTLCFGVTTPSSGSAVGPIRKERPERAGFACKWNPLVKQLKKQDWIIILDSFHYEYTIFIVNNLAEIGKKMKPLEKYLKLNLKWKNIWRHVVCVQVVSCISPPVETSASTSAPATPGKLQSEETSVEEMFRIILNFVLKALVLQTDLFQFGLMQKAPAGHNNMIQMSQSTVFLFIFFILTNLPDALILLMTASLSRVKKVRLESLASLLHRQRSFLIHFCFPHRHQQHWWSHHLLILNFRCCSKQ